METSLIFAASQLVGAMAAAARGTGNETLQERIAALQATLAVNSAALAHKKRQRSKIERQQEQGGLGPVGRQRTLCVYVLSSYNADLAVRAACQCSTLKDPTSPGYPTRAFVENLFLAASDADLNSIQSPEGTHWAGPAQDAARFLAEAATFSWVQECNKVGVGPLSMDVFGYYEQKAFGSTVDIGMPARRYVNRWVQRWRSKWGLRRKVLRQEIQSDPAILQAKAGGFKDGGPVFGSVFWTQKRCRLMFVFLRGAPKCGPKNRSFSKPFFVPFPAHGAVFLQVKIFWKLLAYYAYTKFAGKQILYLNLDETSIPYTMKPLPGCVSLQDRRHRMKVKKQDVRGALTYVSIICDSKDIQCHLPHYLIGSEAKITKKFLRAQQALPQTSLRVLRRKSAWTTSADLVLILKELATVLKSWPTLQPVLILDAAPSHLPKTVMQTARRCKIQLLFVPAGCTDKLQPLDLAAFSAFKSHLKRKQQVLRAGSVDGLIDPLAWVFDIMQCPRYFFAAKSWARSFESIGASNPPRADRLHSELQRFFGEVIVMPEGSKPSAAELQSIWPERRRMAYAYKALL